MAKSTNGATNLVTIDPGWPVSPKKMGRRVAAAHDVMKFAVIQDFLVLKPPPSIAETRH